MKRLITDYTFVPASKQIVFGGGFEPVQSGLLIITNTTTGTLIYNFADSTLTGTFAGNVLTLTYNTAAMAVSDVLQIWYEDGSSQASSADMGQVIDVLNNIYEIQVQMRNACLIYMNMMDRRSGITLHDLMES